MPDDFTVLNPLEVPLFPQIRCLVLDLGLGPGADPAPAVRVSPEQPLDLPPSVFIRTTQSVLDGVGAG